MNTYIKLEGAVNTLADLWRFEQEMEYSDTAEGEWVGETDGYWNGELIHDVWYCPFCDYRIEEDEQELLPNYCPNRRAKMKEASNTVMLSEKVDEIIKHTLSNMDVPDEMKVFNEFTDESRMLFSCMFLIGNSLITEDEKAVLKEWLKETAMMT